jgi:sarcosine oxidase gamma subunit
VAADARAEFVAQAEGAADLKTVRQVARGERDVRWQGPHIYLIDSGIKTSPPWLAFLRQQPEKSRAFHQQSGCRTGLFMVSGVGLRNSWYRSWQSGRNVHHGVM